MKVRFPLTLLVTAAALAVGRADEPAAPAPAPAAPAAPTAEASPAAPAASPAAPKGDDDQTELGSKMEKMGKALRKLGKEVSDPTKNADSLAQLAVIEDGAKASETLTPAKAADLPADQRAAFVADYRKGIQQLESKLSALGEALKAGKNDEAAALVKGIRSFEKQEHKEFRKPEDH